MRRQDDRGQPGRHISSYKPSLQSSLCWMAVEGDDRTAREVSRKYRGAETVETTTCSDPQSATCLHCTFCVFVSLALVTKIFKNYLNLKRSKTRLSSVHYILLSVYSMFEEWSRDCCCYCCFYFKSTANVVSLCLNVYVLSSNCTAMVIMSQLRPLSLFLTSETVHTINTM